MDAPVVNSSVAPATAPAAPYKDLRRIDRTERGKDRERIHIR